MTNWVDHRLTITGPEMELNRFASCFAKAKEGDLFTQYFIDKHCDGRPRERPVGELYFDFDKLGPSKPEDSDKWVLNRWGIKWVACRGKIEVAAGEIKLAWESSYAPALAVYEELAELFPLLTMEGDYWEYGFCVAGDVRCHGGKFTHVDKSEEFAAEIEAWEATSAKEHDDQFYADILKFVTGEPNGITPGTVGETQALIARKLVAEEPSVGPGSGRGKYISTMPARATEWLCGRAHQSPSAAGSAMARCIRMDRHRLRTLRSTNVALRVSLLMPCR